MLLQMALFHSFLWLSPSYTYHIIFIHSSVEGHLGCFHFLTTVISAVMNIGVHVSFLIKIFIFLDICPGVKLLDHMLLLLFNRSVMSDLCNPWWTAIHQASLTLTIYQRIICRNLHAVFHSGWTDLHSYQ